MYLLLSKSRNSIQLGDIELDRSGLLRSMCLHKLVQVFLPAAHCDHEDAALDEPLGKSEADSCRDS